MKKLISPKMQFLVILILISVLTISKITNKNNITYLALGDGYARGVNSYGIEEYGYSDYFRDELQKKNKLKLYSKAFSKRDISIKMLKNNIIDNEKQLNNKTTLYLKEQLQEADIISLSVGLNDLKYAIMLEENMTYEKLDRILNSIEKDYDELIKEIKKYYKHDIYVIGYPINYLESYYISMGIRRLNNYLNHKEEITFISVDLLETDKNKYFSNPISNYPNREGYLVLSNEIYEKYQKKLAK